MKGDDKILLGHGGGGRLTRDLIDKEIVSRFGGGPLQGLPDGARLDIKGDRIVFSTDSFVVAPLRFPGGDIGKLAVHGTVNDVAVSGGAPRWLSLALIIEEGLELGVLREILDSIAEAAKECGVTVATGDTKVVSRGQCDGLYINTAGIGEPIEGLEPDIGRIERGDVIIASGPLGDHGMAVMAAREGLGFAQGLRSDTAPVHRLVQAAATWAGDIKFMRDPTRGGTAAVLNEIVEGQSFGVVVQESALPYSPEAKAISEVLGIDLLHVASEGRMLLVCSPERQDEVLSVWKALPEGRGAAVIGSVTGDAGRVLLETAIGGRRMIDVPQGELLPRIC